MRGVTPYQGAVADVPVLKCLEEGIFPRCKDTKKYEREQIGRYFGVTLEFFAFLLHFNNWCYV